jgi:hypothetical protein
LDSAFFLPILLDEISPVRWTIGNYPAKYNEPLPFSQRVVIAARLLANIMHGTGVEEARG